MNVALLHGFAGDPAVWADVPFDGTALALPGHGPPVLPTWDANIAAMGDHDLVIGYSLGARIALGMFARGQARRAILIGVNPGVVDRRGPAAAGSAAEGQRGWIADRAVRRAGDAAWAKLLREQGIEVFADRWVQQPLFASQARVDPARLAVRRALRLRRDPEQLARSLEVMGLAEMPDLTGAMRDPRVQLVAGADDAKYIALAGELPLTLIPGSGHDPTLEQPALLGAQLVKLASS